MCPSPSCNNIFSKHEASLRKANFLLIMWAERAEVSDSGRKGGWLTLKRSIYSPACVLQL